MNRNAVLTVAGLLLSINPAFAAQADEDCFQAMEKGKAALSKNDVQQALKFFRSAQQLQQSDARPYFWIGYCLEKANDSSGAVKAYAQCIEAEKLHGMDSAELRLDLGNALCRLNYFKEAIYDYKRAIEIDPTLVVAHLALARAQVSMKDWNSALVEMDYCANHGFAAPELNYLRALALDGMGRRNDAIQALQTFITEQPTLQNSQIMQKALALRTSWQHR